jgi:GNAT superfamily N-acetyltransferase
VRITRLDPAADTAALHACHQIELECSAADDPAGPPWSWQAFRAWCTFGWTGEPRQVWLAADDDGKQAGFALLELPERDNATRAGLVLFVRPDSRRAGAGTALLRHCADQARQAGRAALDGAYQLESAGSAFARAIDAQPSLHDIRRELRVDADLRALLRPLAAEAAAAADGYTLLNWSGPTPPELADQLARVVAAMADAPLEPGREPGTWDADRIRAGDYGAELRGDRRYTVAARHDASGELAAMTALHVDPEVPEYGFQELTAVARGHRGHRLGLATKVAMLELIVGREPQVGRIITFNAEDNKHMVAINERLGFAVTGRFRSCDIEVSRLLNQPG